MSVIAQAGTKARQLHKFGGSSLADVKCYLRVAGIMAEYSQPGDMMVVSAAGSTTNTSIKNTDANGKALVLVSSTVRDLVVGSELRFEDRGERELRGVPGEWRLWAVA